MTQHRGRRSEFNLQRRFVRRIVAETARLDRIRGEHICMLTQTEAIEAVEKRFNVVALGSVCFERGEVVTDSRGKGSLQLPIDPREWMLAIDNG